MGIFLSVTLSIFFLFLTNFSFLLASDSTTTISFSPPPQSSAAEKTRQPVGFKPSTAVIVGVLTIIFSLTFLLLLYAKHCRRGDNNAFLISDSRSYPPVAARKNSGVNRAVVESLPTFRFSSLRGQKDGLECAVCLNRFEPTEVLRLLPKCKHAFHVECVDTWLDAHSTCPLCRYRVDPEDILLVEDNRASGIPSTQQSPREVAGGVSRVSGRHSFAGNPLEVIVEKPGVSRRSLDSWSFKKKRNSESVAVGCFDHRPRKDGLLLAEKTSTNGRPGSEQRRLEHRIIVSGGPESDQLGPPNHRWSDVQPSDMLFLQSEMILSDSRRFFKGSRFPAGGVGVNGDGNNESGKDVIKGRSVSEITGVGRFRSNEQQREYECEKIEKHRQWEQRKRQAGAVSRWLAWISQSQISN